MWGVSGDREVGGVAERGGRPEGMLSRGLAGVTAADDGEDTPGRLDYRLKYWLDTWIQKYIYRLIGSWRLQTY